jgi:gamma-glutamylcyclotransferase (GGCT)/AIG2-like uncharacterized protein YtfP
MAETCHRNRPLFAYGTLMFPAVVQSVIGRVPTSRPATIQGYRRLEVTGESFPGLIEGDGASIQGLLYYDLGKDEWERLTAFEDDFYDLEEVTVFSAQEAVHALAYIVPPARKSALSEKAWDPEDFRKNHLVHFSRSRAPEGPMGNQDSAKIQRG